MPEMKTLNGYEVVDAKAREDIEALQNAGHATEEYVDEAIAAIPKPDYTGLATEAYVDNAIDNIPEVDLSKHALKSELPTKVSQLQNDSKFITREEVPETDLSAYAKKSEIPDVSDFITSIPSEYITESELNAKGYLTQHQDISGKADKNHTHTEYLTEHQDISHLAPKSSIPTKVSQLANDSNYLTSIPSTYITEAELEAKNYLTEHQSLAAYATKTYVDNTVADSQPNLSSYAKKSDIPDVSDFISEIPSEYVTDSELAAKGYLVEADLSEYAKKSELPDGVDLSEYAKKSEIPTVPTKTSQLTNDSNFLTAIPAEYVTETELDNKGYLTEHQSLDGLATEKYVDEAVANLDISEANAEIVLLQTGTNGDTITDEKTIYILNQLAAGIVLPCRFDFGIACFASYSSPTATFYVDVPSNSAGYFYSTTFIFRYTKTNEVWTFVSSTSYRKMHYTKTSQLTNDSGFITAADIPEISLDGYATEKYVDDAIKNAEHPTFFLNFVNVSASAKVADEEMIRFGEYASTHDDYSVFIRDNTVGEETYYFPALVQKSDSYQFAFSKASVNMNKVAQNQELAWSVIILIKTDGVWKYHAAGNAKTTIATKTYVDDAVANIDIPESNSSFYDLVFGASGTGTAVTDAKTIEYLEAYFRGELPLCALHGIPVAKASISSNTLTLYAETLAAGGYSSTTHVRKFTRNAENDWTFTLNSNYSLRHYEKTSQLINDAGFVKQTDIDTSLEGYATETYVDDAIAGIEVPDTSTFATQEYVDTEVASISGASSKKPVYEFEYDDLTNTSFVNLLTKITDGSKKVEDYELYLIDKSPNLDNWGTQDYAKVRIMSCTCQGFLSNAPQTMFGLWMDNDGNFVAISYAYQGTKNYDTGTYSYTVTRKAIKLSGTVM